MDTLSTFAALSLSERLVTAVTAAGLTIPTPIQAAAIPVVAGGRDVVGIAQTGTGKTFAFGLPLLDFLSTHPTKAGLVLVPTRELALQVAESLEVVIKNFDPAFRPAVVMGGIPMRTQIGSLRRQAPRIIVATPGRLVDLLKQGVIGLGSVGYLVIDEADRMFDMGFAPQVEEILRQVPTKRQTLLFSATMSNEVRGLTTAYQVDPERIEVAPPGTGNEKIIQELIVVKRDEKEETLCKLLERFTGSVLVFSRTKHGATKLTSRLRTLGHPVTEIHANRTLAQRQASLSGFKSGLFRVMIATDIAARGIDVRGIELVVNYDLPDAAEDYVHRIGRTGRAGQSGTAISLATPDQERDIRAIERLMNIRLERTGEPMDSFESRGGGRRRSGGGGGRPSFGSSRPSTGGYDRQDRPRSSERSFSGGGGGRPGGMRPPKIRRIVDASKGF